MERRKDPAAVADKVIGRSNSRDPERIAHQNGILIREVDWKEQSGAYIEIMRQPIIYVAERLDPVMRSIVIAHELGHLCLGHRAPTSAAERRADAFAAVLLMPPAVILACEAMLRRPLTVGEMLSAFNVSSSAALRMRRQLTAAPPLRFSAAERELVRRLMGRATQGNPPFPDR